MYSSKTKRLQVSLTNSAMEDSVMAIVEALEETEEWHGRRPPGYLERWVLAHIKT